MLRLESIRWLHASAMLKVKRIPFPDVFHMSELPMIDYRVQTFIRHCWSFGYGCASESS
jgi:hypothetical protein